MKVIFTAVNSKYIHTALGLRYISEYCKLQGHNVTLIEETINTPILTILEKLMLKEADIYAFSVHIWNKPVVYKLKLIYMDEPPYEILATAYMPYKEMQLLKRLENVFEQVYNSGCFINTLRHLTAKKTNSFTFYRQLTEWWAAKGHYPQVHNSRSVAKILYDYINEHTEDETLKSTLIEVLRYDVFMHIDGWRPEWLRWNTETIFDKVSAFWRNEDAVREYLPDYKFSSWQQIRKYYPVELFYNNPINGQQDAIYILRDLRGEGKNIYQLNI